VRLDRILTGTSSDYTFLGEIRDIGGDASTIVAATGDTSAVLSIPEFKKGTLKVNISPNPVIDFIKVTIPNIQNTTTISIYNLSGKRLLKADMAVEELDRIDISSLAKGMYFIAFKNESKLAVRKILKK